MLYALLSHLADYWSPLRVFQYITMRGVSIGDSAGRAVGQYGLPDAVVYAADNTTYEYFWQDDKEQQLRFALEVDKQSRVTAFILEKLKKK